MLRFGEYLRELRKARGFSITALAHKIGVTLAYLADIEKRPGKRPPTPERVAAIAAVLGLSPDETAHLQTLATAERLPPEFRDKVDVRVELVPPIPAATKAATPQELLKWKSAATLPLLAEVPAGDPRSVHDEVLAEHPVPLSAARPGRYLLHVKGSSLAPTLLDGDIVLVDGASPATARSVVAARIADSTGAQSTIKQLYLWRDRIVLHALNPEYSDMIFLKTGEQDETGAELFDYEGQRVRLFIKGVVSAILWRALR
jgi:SOS-response transcriptional repressor LexA